MLGLQTTKNGEKRNTAVRLRCCSAKVMLTSYCVSVDYYHHVGERITVAAALPPRACNGRSISAHRDNRQAIRIIIPTSVYIVTYVSYTSCSNTAQSTHVVALNAAVRGRRKASDWDAWIPSMCHTLDNERRWIAWRNSYTPSIFFHVHTLQIGTTKYEDALRFKTQTSNTVLRQ